MPAKAGIWAVPRWISAFAEMTAEELMQRRRDTISL
jgi:hypothetical protein